MIKKLGGRDWLDPAVDVTADDGHVTAVSPETDVAPVGGNQRSTNAQNAEREYRRREGEIA